MRGTLQRDPRNPYTTASLSPNNLEVSMVLTRIEPMSLAKVYAVLGALYGLLVGLPIACFMSMMGKCN